ncbi:hypothetical protein [Nesterenkonia alba]|uniref:hypothetical protein n=1 Tax=Nesterenkonia alba TaxID=515814 RepID=UPI0003B650BA|nr:hypothetical protein [Nesterenkonia alba]
MTKYHISKSGEPAPCKAAAGNCPLGSEQDHFENKQDAVVEAERRFAEDADNKFGTQATAADKEKPTDPLIADRPLEHQVQYYNHSIGIALDDYNELKEAVDAGDESLEDEMHQLGYDIADMEAERDRLKRLHAESAARQSLASSLQTDGQIAQEDYEQLRALEDEREQLDPEGTADTPASTENTEYYRRVTDRKGEPGSGLIGDPLKEKMLAGEKLVANNALFDQDARDNGSYNIKDTNDFSAVLIDLEMELDGEVELTEFSDYPNHYVTEMDIWQAEMDGQELFGNVVEVSEEDWSEIKQIRQQWNRMLGSTDSEEELALYRSRFQTLANDVRYEMVVERRLEADSPFKVGDEEYKAGNVARALDEHYYTDRVQDEDGYLVPTFYAEDSEGQDKILLGDLKSGLASKRGIDENAVIYQPEDYKEAAKSSESDFESLPTEWQMELLENARESRNNF